MKHILLILLISAPLVARADDVRWRTIPYADLYAAFMAIHVEGTYLRSRTSFQVRGRNFTIEDLRVEIDAAEGTLVVRIHDDGLAEFPLDAALQAENPSVRTNAPQGGLGAAIRYSAEAEPVQVFRYSLLEEMAAEYRAAVRAQGLRARIALPRAKGLLLQFDSPDAHARVLLAQPVQLDADEGGSLFIPITRRWSDANPSIELSEHPREIVLALD